MKSILSVFAVLFVLGFGVTAQAQEKPTQEKAPQPFMQHYSVNNKKALRVGDRVWVNIGDTQCTYGGNRPSSSNRCLKEYHRARIAETIVMYGNYVYRVEFTLGNHPGERNAGFDDLFEIVNVPAKWAKYSRYFLALNW